MRRRTSMKMKLTSKVGTTTSENTQWMSFNAKRVNIATALYGDRLHCRPRLLRVDGVNLALNFIVMIPQAAQQCCKSCTTVLHKLHNSAAQVAQQ